MEPCWMVTRSCVTCAAGESALSPAFIAESVRVASAGDCCCPRTEDSNTAGRGRKGGAGCTQQSHIACAPLQNVLTIERCLCVLDALAAGEETSKEEEVEEGRPRHLEGLMRADSSASWNVRRKTEREGTRRLESEHSHIYHGSRGAGTKLKASTAELGTNRPGRDDS
eukprot:5853608-Prymnesium_polylepis.2